MNTSEMRRVNKAFHRLRARLVNLMEDPSADAEKIKQLLDNTLCQQASAYHKGESK